VLSFNIGNLTKKATKVKDRALEIETAEIPNTQNSEIKQTPQVQVKHSPTSNSNAEGSIASSSSEVEPASVFDPPSASPNTVSVILPYKPVIKADKQPIAVAPIKVEDLKTQLTTLQKVAPIPKSTVNRQPVPLETTPQQKPIVTPSPPASASAKLAPTTQEPPVAVNRPASNLTSPAQQPSDRQLRQNSQSTDSSANE
jgi:hypothetical protein